MHIGNIHETVRGSLPEQWYFEEDSPYPTLQTAQSIDELIIVAQDLQYNTRQELEPGWFSELQNDMFEADKEKVDALMNFYDMQCVNSTNMQTLEEIENILKVPFRYTPTDFIQGNECVMTGIWLHVPDDWKQC
ncbi:hypothetical protein EDM56_07810 [Brevibacillus fluminis]|uniref:Uncharacterized protein n=1 Tax=Brevibacillus fluminis TaxID=511487 RepID=A0A3M8DQL4_9BACL|nr:hypothetical protein [Brevibacillus fluminis]RNB90410.1 hypothetical protein EDM56_07810 [Brevibacillus fluminis]